MGKASRAKRERRTREQNRPALRVLLREQYEFLNLSAASFDAGFEAEAKRLAVALRVLLHDTASSTSLLGQLGVKDRIKYVDTALRLNPSNLLTTNGLAVLATTTGEPAKWRAPLDSLAQPRQHPDATFASWWTSAVTKDQDGEMWNRKELVLALANRDGGAHVDPALDERYLRLAHENTMGWIEVTPDGEQPMRNSPVLASVRQIAHEVIRAIEKHLATDLPK